MSEQLHLALNPVRADRAQDFERFLSDVVEPAVQAQRPDLEGRWRVARTDGPGADMVTYVFLLEGGSLEDDWDLGTLLTAHHGDEEAERLFQDWDAMFAPLDAWGEAAVATAEESGQVVLTLDPVSQG
jgi:hypothetical protein